jgi:hypothetical protein
MVLMAELLDPGAVGGQGTQWQRGPVGHADLVCVQGERDHGVVADQRGQFDDAGGAVTREDALVGRVGDAVVAQQFGGIVVDRLLVRLLECAAAVTQGLDRAVRQSCLARLGLVRGPLELTVL